MPSKLQITTVSYRRCVRAGSAYYLICLARERADAALDRVHDLCSKSNTTEGSSYVPLVDEYELVSEFDDLRGVVLRESSDESDDSADSEHSSDDDTASADSDGGSDSDESDGA